MPRQLRAIGALVLSATLLTSSGFTLHQDWIGPSPEEVAEAITGAFREHDRYGHGVVTTNVALHKPARQIDTLDNRGVAQHAVDGNTNGDFNSKSTTHTSTSNEPWWEVDLLVEAQIFSVNIFNRVDCCQDRLTNFDVEFYDYAHRLLNSVHYGGPPTNEYSFGLQPTVVARYVRVQQRQITVLSLAEVKVFGRAVGAHQNVAKGKIATQSSTLSNPANPVASKAVDGNTDGSFPSASTTHTNQEQSPWWKVDLGKEYQITAITLWNRVDCCGERLNNFQIILSDDGVTAVKTISYSSGTNDILPFTVFPPTWARHVKVQIIVVGTLQLAEVQVFTDKSNLALSKPAAQSSSTHNTVAALAVDGNTDGIFNSRSVTHTNSNPKEWWEVDLGHQSEITSVSLYNRVDCCQDRLTNFEVQLFDYAHSFVTKAFQGSNVKTQYDFDFPEGTVARHVRVQLLGQNVLSLAEVEVYGTPLGGYENVAFQKPATQSSTLSNPAIPVAGKAVDGDTNGFFSDASTTHTNNEAGPWWQVDLGSEFSINAVTIYNRIDCCGDRLQNFDVILSNSRGTEVHRFEHGTGVQVIFVFKLTIPSQARYVKVKLRGTGTLQLAEVQVFSGAKTCSGTAAYGSRCYFPFVYEGKTFDSCTTSDESHRRPWCATQSGVVTGSSKWGYCLC